MLWIGDWLPNYNFKFEIKSAYQEKERTYVTISKNGGISYDSNMSTCRLFAIKLKK